ncbi:MAG: acetyl-CoA carboxylase biotin carboxylase subunit [Firmicutes bacterium]|nr:acetyl-CoA carboxylase biotin carboxylase subunit [Bacillota bacterium]
MFSKILVANRGEIAVRVIRACKELGIRTVAIYSEADEAALHVRLADEAVCVGPASSARSYLNIPNIMSAALLTGAEAIHPGYGYLAERARFAEICEDHGIEFIGPKPWTIEIMGDKAAAKKAMEAAGVPVITGSDGPVESDNEALRVAREIGYPVIVKAAAGGGGKGMRVVHCQEDFLRALNLARAEADAAFGNGEVYIEKFIDKPRHVEIQIAADRHGNVVHLGERECSLQRRQQKILEEAPCIALTPKLRQAMGEAAVAGAKAVEYVNTGTVEFLVDQDGQFYFMEMNTRIQVEHPVTEMITGIDLVKEQLRIAAGERLSFSQDDVTLRGHAIECRINAENPEAGFIPSPGVISAYHAPGGMGVRVDSSIYPGWEVSPFYDPMIAKIIAWGRNREEAIARMEAALSEMVIEGIATSIPFHLELLRDGGFRSGRFHTKYIEEEFMTGR